VQAKTAVATPVYITYFTAAALQNAEGIISYPDIYGRDGKVVTALNAKGGAAGTQVAAR
jgi:murein L,D-transpeptidase YcbB/YkuD